MKYFLHDTNAFNDEKVTELFMKFGYEGLGLFYTILEKFASQEKPIKTDVIKAQLRIGKRLNKCWTFMEEIDLIQSINGESFNKQLLNFSESYQIKKEKTRKKVSEWREKQKDKENVTSYVPVSNPPKVKGSKVKENKEEVYTSAGHLSITWNEMNKLIDEFGEIKADEYIKQVLNYRKNVKYKSLYLTALKWLRKDHIEKTEKPKLSI